MQSKRWRQRERQKWKMITWIIKGGWRNISHNPVYCQQFCLIVTRERSSCGLIHSKNEAAFQLRWQTLSAVWQANTVFSAVQTKATVLSTSQYNIYKRERWISWVLFLYYSQFFLFIPNVTNPYEHRQPALSKQCKHENSQLKTGCTATVIVCESQYSNSFSFNSKENF